MTPTEIAAHGSLERVRGEDARGTSRVHASCSAS